MPLCHLPIARVLAVLALLGALIVPAAPAGGEPHPLLGKPAPTLSGRAAFGSGLLNLNRLQNELVREVDAQGRPVLKDGRPKLRLKKHAVVLNFFATYCVPCIQEIPTFNRLAQDYADRPVRFVYVNVDTEKSAAEVRAFAKEKGIAVEMILPSVRYVVDAYSIDALPRIMVVDRDGIVRHVILGFQEDLAAQIGAVLEDVLGPEGAGGRAG